MAVGTYERTNYVKLVFAGHAKEREAKRSATF
jgi:hypothetical protein